MKTRLISSLLLVFICLSLCTPGIAAEAFPPAQESPAVIPNNGESVKTANGKITVEVEIYQDKTYQTKYAGTNNMYDTWQNVIPPFAAQWNLDLNPHIMNMRNGVSVTDTCPLVMTQECKTSTCGSVCVNDYIQTSNHHKNIYAMYWQFHNSSWRGNRDIH